MSQLRRVWVYGVVAVVGLLLFVGANIWSAIDYNAIEDQLGEGQTGPVAPGILLLAVAGGGLFLVALAGLAIALFEARRHTRDDRNH